MNTLISLWMFAKKKKSNTSQLADTTALIAVVNRESSLAEGALKRMLLY